MGVVLLVLGFMHFFNLAIFAKIRRRGLETNFLRPCRTEGMMQWLLYDGECGFCRAVADALWPKLGKKGLACSPADQLGGRRLGSKPEDLLTEIRVVKSDGSMKSGSGSRGLSGKVLSGGGGPCGAMAKSAGREGASSSKAMPGWRSGGPV